MPCDSRITNTQMTDEARVLDSLRDLGIQVDDSTTLRISTVDGLSLYRAKVGDAYRATGNVSRLAEVGKKYAEIGMRQWARKNGLLVRSVDEKGATLVSVRR